MTRRLVPIACVLASASLYAASFPPLALSGLAWVALVPFLWAASRSSPLGGGALGFLLGASGAASMTAWLPGTLSAFFGVGAGSALLIAAAVYAYCAVFVAAFGAGVAWLARRGRFGAGPVALLWAACEGLRIHGPFAAPWAPIAYSQASWPLVIQTADHVGAVGVGALLVAVNAALAGVLVDRSRAPRFARSALATAVAVALALTYGALRLGQDFGAGEAVSVALVQGAIAREMRIDPERDEQNLEHYLSLTRAVRSRPDLVLWPELALRFDPSRRPALWERFAVAARASSADWLVGAPITRERLLVREPVNAALIVRGGRVVDHHEKVGLMPFAEARVPPLPFGEDHFRPGLELRPVQTRAGPLGVLLCSEALYAGFAARLAGAGAGILAIPSNDDWLATEAAAEHQVAVAVFRAVENRRPVLRVSTTGGSAVVDARGRVLERADHGEPARLEATVRPSHSATAFGRVVRSEVGTVPGWVLSSVLLLAVTGRRASAR